MESKNRPIIVGIDPGTTTAYACLDIYGKIIAIGSAKEFSLGKLIFEVSEAGLPIIVSTDKSATPSFVKDFSVKVGARLYSPKADLLIMEKQEIIKTLKEPSHTNSHEMDALASALFAYRNIHPLIKKLNLFIERHGKENIADELARLVIVKGIPLSIASEYIEKQKERKQDSSTNLTTSKDGIRNRDYSSHILELVKRNISLSDEILFLSGQINPLRLKILSLEKIISHKESKIEKKVYKERVSQGVQFKDKIISGLNFEIKQKDSLIKSLNSEVNLVYSFIEDIDKFIIVKSLDNLGANALNSIRLNKGDIIYVKNASEFSKNTLEKLYGVVSFIIATNPSSEIKKRFSVIDAKKIELFKPTASSPFYFAKKTEFEKLIDERTLLARVLMDYEEEKMR
jgi:predicted RNase H-like nuclease (RuvC/YqgF family)